jgi:hypothetical protein
VKTKDVPTEGAEEGKDTKTILLLISPFEAETYFDLFRVGRTGVVAGSLHMWAPRVTQEGDTLFDKPGLTLPATSTALGLKLAPDLTSSLLLYSGSSYFEDDEEMMNYCRYLGFIPRPWTVAEETLFNAGKNHFINQFY